MSLQIDLVSIFPAMFDGPLGDSIIQRARKNGLVEIRQHNLRDFALDKHRQVDDAPFGGSPGMVLKPEPLFRAVESLRRDGTQVLLTAANGTPFVQTMAHRLAGENHLIILCGHYKGVDQRVIDELVDLEISLGDFILTGGEIAAMAIVDSVVRLLPGALGDADSAATDSFEDGLLEEPLYTRPSRFRDLEVPEILLSGHHARIAEWRGQMRRVRTEERRTDLLRKDKS